MNFRHASFMFVLGVIGSARCDARFLQTDPVGYDTDLNLYTYASNDPTDKLDPLGRYDCTSNCSAIDAFVGAINQSLEGLDPNSDAYQRVSGVVNYLGGPGEHNGVTIESVKLSRNIVSEARPNDTIAIDVRKAGDVKGNGLMQANPDKSEKTLQNARGGARIAHEAQNEMGLKRNGNPQTSAAETSLEKMRSGRKLVSCEASA